MSQDNERILIAIPAHNEESTIRQVVEGVRRALPEQDLLVVNDGSLDETGSILRTLGVYTTTHLCNLGYGRAIQTAIKYALRNRYDVLITLDADGQHQPEQIQSMLKRFGERKADCLVGSRYVESHNYGAAPLGRRLGMRVFSLLTQIATRKRIYDTTSGLKIMRRSVFEPLTQWHFVDFHAEAIVYLLRLGFEIGEHPITVSERTAGQSMYSAISHIIYPLKTALMIFLGAIQADLTRRKRRQ